MKMRGARILIEALRCENVSHIFGYPGGAVLHVYDEIARSAVDLGVTHYLVRHEQGALFAAAGYAQATGKTGVALVTSGPGGTNAVTGIANAFMDSIPIVVFTGQVPTHLIGNDAFQEADLTGITQQRVSQIVKEAKPPKAKPLKAKRPKAVVRRAVRDA